MVVLAPLTYPREMGQSPASPALSVTPSSTPRVEVCFLFPK